MIQNSGNNVLIQNATILDVRVQMTMRRLLLAAATVAATLGSFSAARADYINVPADGGKSYNVPVTSLREARYRSTIRQQFDFSCGSAAVATLLTYQYGYPVTEQTVFANMYVNGDQAKIRAEGFSLLDMKRFLESRGFLADGYELPLSSWRKRRYRRLS